MLKRAAIAFALWLAIKGEQVQRWWRNLKR